MQFCIFVNKLKFACPILVADKHFSCFEPQNVGNKLTNTPKMDRQESPVPLIFKEKQLATNG